MRTEGSQERFLMGNSTTQISRKTKNKMPGRYSDALQVLGIRERRRRDEDREERRSLLRESWAQDGLQHQTWTDGRMDGARQQIGRFYGQKIISGSSQSPSCSRNLPNSQCVAHKMARHSFISPSCHATARVMFHVEPKLANPNTHTLFIYFVL